MNKSTFFTGQPVFTQLLKLIPKSLVAEASLAFEGNRYCKKFDTYHHLVTMLFACYQQCHSLREITTGMRACEGKLQSLGLNYLPARSTFAEANKRRDYKIFAKIYLDLYALYKHVLPDSRFVDDHKNIVIVDATAISLFQEIIEGTGRKKANGKRKGGIKVHTAMYAHEDVPFFIDLTKGGHGDQPFLKKFEIPPQSIVLLDRGYNNYKKFAEWAGKEIDWVTRKRKDTSIDVIRENQLTHEDKDAGVISDEVVKIGSPTNKISHIECRLVKFYDKDHKRHLEFITNNQQWTAAKVAALYKRRWQIELLFKRLKQNMPLQYFLGDNEQAIKTQIYCALIADLLLKIALSNVKRKWAFSNIACLVRLHLMHYTDLKKFLENPEKAAIVNPIPQNNSPQLPLFNWGMGF